MALDPACPKKRSFDLRVFVRTAAGKMAALGLAAGVAVAGGIALIATSTTSAPAHAAPEAAASPTAVSLGTLATQRDTALAADTNAIDQASENAAATNREAALTSDGTAIAAEASRLKNLSTFLWPTKGAVVSPFGYRMHPILHQWLLHDGVDIGAPCGQNVYAAQAGTVISAQMGYNGGEGNNVHVNNGDINGAQIETAYFHLTNYVVTVGQYVDKGQLIGHVGTTGLSTGCHLHFMLHKNGVPTNPLDYAKPPTNTPKASANAGES